MNIDELKQFENKIYEECELKLHNLRKQYLEENKKYNIGEFVGNITGIIKVEKIEYEIFSNNIEIVYIGHRYKKNKGQIFRTKDKNLSSLRESDNLKLINL